VSISKGQYSSLSELSESEEWAADGTDKEDGTDEEDRTDTDKENQTTAVKGKGVHKVTIKQ
jgi:hypothetical protein